jgi:DNA-binding NarL/FixJ family response regulator
MARQHLNVSRKIRLFLVDDESIVRKGLQLLCCGEPNLTVCGEAETEDDALEGIMALQPDLAIVDLSLRLGDGLALTKRLHKLCPALKILVFSMHNQVHFASAAFSAGAQGYIVKEEGTEKVLEAIQVVMDGGYYLSGQVAAKVPGHRTRTGYYKRQPLQAGAAVRYAWPAKKRAQAVLTRAAYQGRRTR